MTAEFSLRESDQAVRAPNPDRVPQGAICREDTFGDDFLKAVGLTEKDVILLDSYPLPKAPRLPSVPRPKRGETVKGRMLTISQSGLDIGDLRSHEIDPPGVYAVFASGARRNQLRNRSIQLNGGNGAYLS